MRIVLVHGRAAEMQVPALMGTELIAALWYGLDRINAGIDPATVEVRFAFYGDIWRPDLHQPLPTIEPRPEAVEGFGLSALSLWVDEHLGVGDALIGHVLRDVDDYFSEPALRTTTNSRLIAQLQTPAVDPDGAIVVGFSMGSLVAYDTLRNDPGLPVRALITIGSPLGMPSFYRRVLANSPILPPAAPTPFPPQLGMWVNVWTSDDPATAGHADLTARYPSPEPERLYVQDVETWGRSAGPTDPAAAHNASDYLGSRVFAHALRTAILMIRAGG